MKLFNRVQLLWLASLQGVGGPQQKLVSNGNYNAVKTVRKITRSGTKMQDRDIE